MTSDILFKDRYNLALIILFLQGIGILLPWNVFITANEYFVNYKLNTTISHDADYRKNFLSYTGICAQLPNLLMAAWNTFYQSKRSTSNPSGRFLTVMCTEIILLVATFILIFIDTSQIPGVFFGITMLTVVLLNSCVGIHQSLIFGIAASFPMQYTNAVVTGNNFCGTLIAILNIITKAVSGMDERSDGSVVLSTSLYFGLATSFILVCVATYFCLQRLDFVTQYLNPGKTVAAADADESGSKKPNVIRDSDEKHGGKGDEEDSFLKTKLEVDDVELPESKVVADETTVEMMHDESSALFNCFAVCCHAGAAERLKCFEYWGRYVETFKECWVQCINVFMVFVCTLSMFPAIQAIVVPVDQNYFIPKEWFTDVTCFLFFNLFALFGCIFSSFVKFPGPRFLSIPIFIRMFLFIPFFMLSNYTLLNSARKMPLAVSNDHVYVFGVILFAFSSGYLSSLCMMYAPRNSPPERAGLAGLITSFFLLFGVFSGVYISRGFLALL